MYLASVYALDPTTGVGRVWQEAHATAGLWTKQATVGQCALFGAEVQVALSKQPDHSTGHS